MKVRKGSVSLVGLLTIAMLLSSCSVRIHTTYDKQVDFTKYKTFCWMTGCEFKFTGPEYLNDSLLRENLKAAIVSELQNKGLQQNTDNPDLLIGFTIAMKDEQTIVYHRTEDTPVYFRPLDSEKEMISYLKGTLIMAMAEKESSKLVWESKAISYMELNPDFSEKNINKGIKLVLKNYPPKKDK